MNIIDVLKKGHSSALRTKVVRYIDRNPERFEELVQLYLAGPYRITQRAAWPLSYCVQAHPFLVKPHLKKLILYLDKKDTHVAVKRNTIRLLQFIDVPVALQGKIVDLCFSFLSDPKETIAVRVFSMTVLANIAAKQPELRNEIIVVIDDQLPYGSSAFKSRGTKTLMKLKNIGAQA